MLYELSEAMKSEAPVKFEINGRMEPYFGIVREIQHKIGGQVKAHVVVEYHDCLDTYLMDEITDVIVG